ncbi:MAG: inorganic triphosphatase [Ensifer alkalisoli]|nr:inorganic triphosphatase [Sinorhizobium alkalisoli]
MQEAELKLELSQSGARSLLKTNPFVSPPTILQQKSVYFDTNAWDLTKRGLSFRIRQSGNERIQTVKAGDGAAAGSFVREEWERPVTADAPVIDDPQIVAWLAGAGPELAPLFEVHVTRHRWNVTAGEAQIEVCLDVGKVVAADREAPLCEIELERKAGQPAALFDLARKVDLITPARLGVLSKAERGYRLLAAAQCAVKASPAPLTSEMCAATAFARSAAVCLRQFRLNEMALSWSRDAEVLHQARVALRRLRSLFSICKSLFQDSRFDHLREELAWLAAETGQARNIDVLIGRARDEELAGRLKAMRGDAYRTLEATLSSARVRSLMIDIDEFISGATADGSAMPMHGRSARDFASTALDRLWKKVARGRRLIDADDAARHRLRIAAKKLRYAAEFFEPLYRSKIETKRHRRFIAAMAGLQDQLGDLNDLAVAPDMLSSLGLLGVAGTEDLFRAYDKAELLRRAAEAHDGLVDIKRFWRSR